MGEQPVESQPSTKFLGLIIDSGLKFEDHIVKLNKTLSSSCYAVRVASAQLGVAVARIVYYSLFESHLRYGIAFWGFCSRQLLNSVFVVQKRAVRYMCGVGYRDHCRPLFLRYEILTVVGLFVLETVCLIHRRHPAEIIVSHSQNFYGTRQNQNLNIRLPIPKLTLTKNSLIYESLKMYNHLSIDLRSLPYLQFRRSVKRALEQRAYYSLEEYYSDVL